MAARTKPTISERLDTSTFTIDDWRTIEAANNALLTDPHIGLRYFIEDAWTVLEPENPFIPNWHLDAIADVLMAITRGDLHDLVINMPPRLAKSLTTVVFWPCWEWGPANLPHLRSMFFSYGQHLTLRDARKRRQVMASRWFNARWPLRIGEDAFASDNAFRYENDKRGYHQASSVGGIGTGEGGDRLIADDPIKADDAHSENIREGVNNWWGNTITTRRNTGGGTEGTGRDTARIVMMHRLHETDLSGYVLAKKAGYYHLFLPMEFDPKRICILGAAGSYPGFRDPRTVPGELLCPAGLIPGPPAPAEKKLANLKREMQESTGTSGYQAQYNQNPEPAGTGILRREWWRYWVPRGHPLAGTKDENGNPIRPLPRYWERTLDSWDAAFKDAETSSFVVGSAWGSDGIDMYLRYLRRDRLTFSESVQAVKDLLYLSKSMAVYVEDKANGTAIIDVLRREVSQILESQVNGSKESRAHAMSPSLQNGHILLPHPSLGHGLLRSVDWQDEDTQTAVGIEAILHECKMFPNGAYDDIVDSFTQAHKHIELLEAFSEDNFSGSQQDMGL